MEPFHLSTILSDELLILGHCLKITIVLKNISSSLTIFYHTQNQSYKKQRISKKHHESKNTNANDKTVFLSLNAIAFHPSEAVDRNIYCELQGVNGGGQVQNCSIIS